MSKSLTAAMMVVLGLPIAVVAQQPGVQQDAQDLNRRQTQQQSADQQTQRRESFFRGSQDSRRQDAQAGAQVSQELVNYLAAKLKLANQCEVETASMAAQRAEQQEVKEFANELVQSHRQLNQQLEQAMPGLKSIEGLASAGASNDALTSRARGAGDFGQAAPGDRRNDPANQPDAQRNNQFGGATEQGQIAGTANRAGSQQGGFLDGDAKKLLDITRRAAENNHEMVKRELSEKQGKEFDRCFVNQQIGAHMWMLSELKAIQGIGPSEFTSVVKEAEQQTQSHLEEAKKIAKTLDEQQPTARAGGQDAPRTGVTEF